MAQDIGRQWTITTVAMGVLVVASMFGEPNLLAGAGVLVLIAGLILLPRDRLRGPILALVAGSIAAIGSGLFGWNLFS
ncbi:MAG: hypothetical protein DWG80_03975 [Chloroflexi bacterium]|nr:hypothetical protein [Chloroflexota bacterium]MQC18219.1 hypothetical protein [Chloroflexota bacterium]MQC48270.1 hypothetical protein [Chloroflexota bacterium]